MCETTNLYDQREVVQMEFESNTLDAVLDGMLRFLRANGYHIEKLSADTHSR
jgi:hypothetical protein